MTSFDVAIVGGGLVGSSIGYHLATRGYETILLDRNDSGRATDAGAGIVYPPTSSYAQSETWFRFALDAADYYPLLADKLAEYDHGYRRSGLLSVAIDSDEIEPFEQLRQLTEQRTDRVNRPRSDCVRHCTPTEAQELYPPLATVNRAIFYADAAQVDGRKFATALLKHGTKSGLLNQSADVEQVQVSDGTATELILHDGNRIEAEYIVIAGGAWSGQFERDLGIRLPISPKRGQILHFDVSPLEFDLPTAEWPIVKAMRHQYQVPWADGRVACGATREEHSGFTPYPTLNGLHVVTTEALRIAPELAEAKHLETRVGLRPVSADDLPVIGVVPETDNVLVATGHGPTGLTLGPYSGKLIGDLIDGRTLESDLGPFSVDRFH